MTSAARDATSSEVAGSDSSDLQKKKAKRQKKKKEDSGIKAESIPGKYRPMGGSTCRIDQFCCYLPVFKVYKEIGKPDKGRVDSRHG